MAEPITKIVLNQLSPAEEKQQKLDHLTELLTSNEEALHQIFSIVEELDEMGALEAAVKLLEAREEATGVALGQFTREPVKNIINNLLAFMGGLTALDPETTKKLLSSVERGVEDANQSLLTDEKVGLFKLVKMLNDPDINRSVKFGMHFLKGMGKGLNE